MTRMSAKAAGAGAHLKRSALLAALAVALTPTLLASGCAPASTFRTSGSSGPWGAQLTGQYIYAAQDDGTIHVYDVAHNHRQITVIGAYAAGVDVRGAAAAAPTHRFYVMYNAGGHGHLVALDLLTNRVLWDKIEHSPGVDRGDVTHDGKTIFLPTWESDASSPYELVIDAATGAVTGRIPLPPKSHDTVISLDGTKVFMETKSPVGTLYIADTTSDAITGTVTGYCCGGVLQVYSVNGSATRVVNDVIGYDGFQIGDLTSGRVIASVPFPDAGAGYGHGIAWSPNEREVWVNDGRKPEVHVFDMTISPPIQTQIVRVSGIPHWVTFSMDGHYAYISGPKGGDVETAIVDTTTYRQIGVLSGSNSEDLLEVDFDAGVVLRVGDQFGIGRVA